MEWAEPLPKNCPPDDAKSPNNELYFRVIESEEPSEIDFYSHRWRWPHRKFNAPECIARSLSILNELEECKKVVLLPLHKNKKIIQINLPENSGKIKQSGRNIHHFSWWRYKSFNALNHCKMASP